MKARSRSVAVFDEIKNDKSSTLERKGSVGRIVRKKSTIKERANPSPRRKRNCKNCDLLLRSRSVAILDQYESQLVEELMRRTNSKADLVKSKNLASLEQKVRKHSKNRRVQIDGSIQFEETKLEEEEEIVASSGDIIRVAEGLLLRIADQIVNSGMQSLQEPFASNLEEVDLNGECVEILSQQGFVRSIRGLGINDLTKKEIQCLMSVLGKRELGGAIMANSLF